MPSPSLVDAAILGVVEGLTEYLPVSSTGHLIVTGNLLKLDGDGVKSFEIVIQLGAILAVVAHYRSLLWKRAVGLAHADPDAFRLVVGLLTAFVPVAVLGLLLRHTIKEHLFGVVPVAAAFGVGALVMIGVSLWAKRRPRPALDGLHHVTIGRALIIGVGQCFSLWPGASRSMCSIVAGQLSGLSTATAAEFSFLLALPTLGAATLYEGWKARHALAAGGGLAPLAVGLAVSFVVAWAVIAVFLAYLKRRGLVPFAIYRLAAAATLLSLPSLFR